jgi:hypothetical protein
MSSIIQTIMLACGPLLGIWFGSRLSSAKEGRQWRRDRFLEAYTDVIRACETLAIEATKVYFETSGSTAQLDISEKVSELHRASQRVALLAQTVLPTLNAVVAHTDSEIAARAGVSPKMSAEEWNKIAVTDLAVLVAKFTDEARIDLGVGRSISQEANPDHLPLKDG